MDIEDKIRQLSTLSTMQQEAEDYIAQTALEAILKEPEEGFKHLFAIKDLSKTMGLYTVLRMAFNHQSEVMELMEDLPNTADLDEYAEILWKLLRELNMAEKARLN